MKSPQDNKAINGVTTGSLNALGDVVKQDFAQGKLQFQATTTWIDGPRSVTRIQSFRLGEETYRQDFNLTIDEPEALGGSSLGPNPQEVLLAGLNSCILTTFVYLASLQGIQLHHALLEILTLHWSAHTGSKPHSHGNSFNITRVVSGTLLERKYAVSGGQLLLKSERKIHAGDWAYTLPHQVHELVVFNDSARTLHFYFPRRQEIHGKPDELSSFSNQVIPEAPRLGC